jgi:hypothetical protein
MWRVVLSILAVVFNAGVILTTLLGFLGFGVNAASHPLSVGDWILLGLFIVTFAGAVISILAVAVGARLRDRQQAGSPAQVASEFS